MLPFTLNIKNLEVLTLWQFAMMFSSAGLFLMATCVFAMTSQSTKSTQELSACDKINRRMRTVACQKEIKTPLVEQIFAKMNISIYSCDLEAIANYLIHFGDYGLKVSSRLFPKVNVTRHLVFKKNITGTAPLEKKASEFVGNALSSWSEKFEEMKAQNLTQVGCNFYLDKEGVGNGEYGYELCCAFN